MNYNKCHCQSARILRCLWLSFLLFSSFHLVAQILPQLTLDKPVTKKLIGGEQQVYQLTLAAEDYVNLTVAYQGIIVAVTLNDPTGKPLAAWSGGNDTVNTAEIAIIAPATGDYELILRGRGATTDTGSYQLEVKSLHPATVQDRQYATAQGLNLEGRALSDLNTAESRRQALGKFQQSLSLWRSMGELRQELTLLSLIANIHRLLDEHRRALELVQEMLTKSRAAGFRDMELKALTYVGALQNYTNDYPAARQTLELALPLSRELKDRSSEILTLNLLGSAFTSMGQVYIAIDYYQQSLKIAREIGDRYTEATILNSLASRSTAIGEPDQAMAYYQKTLALCRQLGDRDAEAWVRLNLGTAQLRRGELQQAFDNVRQSQTHLHTAGRPAAEARALELLGQLHALMGEYPPAQEYFKQALAIYRAVAERNGEAICLRRLSSIEERNGEIGKAKALDLLQQSLAIHRSLSMSSEIITDLRDLGEAYIKRDEPRQSLIHLSEAVKLSRDMGSVADEAQCLLQVSRAHQALEEIKEAKDLLQTLLPLSQKLKNRLLEADIEYDLASLSLKQGRHEDAQLSIEAALRIIESSRTGLVNPEARANFRSDKQSYYEVYTDVLAQRAAQQNNPHLAAQALESVERARARSLLDLLTEKRIDIRQGVDGELLKREQELQRRLSAKEELLRQLSTKKSDDERAKSLQAEITTLTADLRIVESHIRVASPAYAALTQPQPLKLAEIQEHLLDRNSLLLEYALGTECSYLFVVTNTSLKIFVLPKRAEIEAAVRKYYELFEKQKSIPIFSDLAKRQRIVAQLEKEQQEAARILSNILLLPAATELQQKRLMIVPDSALQYVPFAALPAPNDESRTRNDEKTHRSPLIAHPLVVDHEIITLPSASTLAIVRQQLAQRAPAPKILALFADPVFGREDQRVAAQTRGISSDAEQKFARLLKSRQEAAAIMALVPQTDRLVALDFDANRTLALSDQLNQYRYLHFATHGIWSESTPELSGLLLSQVDQGGNSQNGFLTTRDVFNLKLKSDLVVLSGCQTAMGKELRGEGLVGLTRGFMYAGARRVVASLWQVNDAATTKLMQHFYQGMLGEKKLTPAAALRAAQIAMWQDQRWNAPQYWAAFVLQGEW